VEGRKSSYAELGTKNGKREFRLTPTVNCQQATIDIRQPALDNKQLPLPYTVHSTTKTKNPTTNSQQLKGRKYCKTRDGNLERHV
jgi:hypothetical protein